MWYVYMIETQEGALYTGISTDVERRWQEHCDVSNKVERAKGAKFFRARRPRRIVYIEPLLNRSQASRREAGIKKMNKVAKQRLCELYMKGVSNEKKSK